MAGETTSPSMNLPIPGVSVTDGPTWATDINNCLNLIDSHTHTSGSGVPITSDAININADLPFASNSATGLKSTQYTAQISLSTLRAVYVIAKDLYYTDADGNAVRITQSGAVAGTPGSISNLVSPASAAYSAAQTKFIWQSNSNIAADMDFGAIITRNITPNSTFAITVSPPASLASNYSITWPALPASQKFMTLDSSGNMAAPWAADGSTVEISGGTTLQVKAGGIGTTQLADGSVTPAKKAALGQQVSSSSGSFTTNSSSFTDVTNLTVTITTTGRPVWLGLQGTTSTSPTSGVYLQRNGSSSGFNGNVVFIRDSTSVSLSNFGNEYPSNSSLNRIYYPPGSFWCMDAPTAGTYTYKVQVRTVSTGSTIDVLGVTECKLLAYEL